MLGIFGRKFAFQEGLDITIKLFKTLRKQPKTAYHKQSVDSY